MALINSIVSALIKSLLAIINLTAFDTFVDIVATLPDRATLVCATLGPFVIILLIKLIFCSTIFASAKVAAVAAVVFCV